MKRTFFVFHKSTAHLEQPDQIQVKRVVQLKTYEQPPPDALQRCSTEVHLHLAEWQNNQHQAGANVQPGALSGWRYGIAAAFVCMIGVNGFIATQIPSLESAEFAPAPEPMMFASTNDHFFTPTQPSNVFRANFDR